MEGGALPLGVAVGDIVDGRYELRREHGRGAAGVVFVAKQQLTGRDVVLKIVAPDLPRWRLPEWRARIAREARALAAVRHPGVVEIIDAGALEDGTPYIVMENLEGRTLEGLLAARGKLSAPVTVALASQICEALRAVHDAGIIHRDLKPSNVIVLPGRDGVETAKLIDFGMAQMRTDERITDVGALVGTPAYMAPEQLLAAEDIDRRVDVYALGVTMFECLTGDVPYQGPYARVILQACTDGPLPSLPAGTDPAVSAVVHRAMAKAREERFFTAPEFAAALRRLAVHLVPPSSGPSTAPEQRRRWRRAPYNTPVEITLANGTIDGRTEDISQGGLLVICWQPCEAGGRVSVRFALPIEGRVIRCDAHLRWARSADPARAVGPRALGLEFIDPSPELQASIEHYVRLMGEET